MKTKPVLVYYFILLASSGKSGWLTRGKKTEDDDYITFIKTNVVIKWVYNIIDFKQFEL